MTSCINAAFANSESNNALDFDDTMFVGQVSHSGATVIPPAIAVGEATHSTGKDLLTAIILGYEILSRIGNSLIVSHSRHKKVSGMQTYQTFGAVTASSKLLDLDEEATAMAFGLTGCAAPVPSLYKTAMNPANKLFGGPMFRNNYGYASEIGVKAALLAQRGYTGPKDVFEGDFGFWRMSGIADRCNFDVMTKGLGKDYYILKVGFKPYSCCRLYHAMIDAALKIVREHNLGMDNIEKITVKERLASLPPNDDAEPKTMLSAMNSKPYSIAIAITGLKPGLRWYENLKDPKVLGLAKKVELIRDPEQRGVNVEIVSSKGTFKDHADSPRGEPENPMTDEELIDKFKDLAEGVINNGTAEKVLDMIKNLEKVEDIAELTQRLRE